MKFDSVAIIGGGESGVGAALLAQSKGMKVFLSEYGKIKDRFRLELEEHKIPFEEEGHSMEKLKEFEIIVKSPGVGDQAEVIRGLNYYGKKIISEIEFGFYFTAVPIIGITGSNGKTTTTGLIYHLLNEAGVSAQVGGNIGKSFARLIFENQACETYVLELSSFQLDGIDNFKAGIAILLNITPDHLDRYDYKFENYVQSKFRIIKNQTEGDLLIYNGDDRSIIENLSLKMTEQNFQAVTKDYYKNTTLSTESGEKFEITNKSLKGQHNRFNALCAIYTAQQYGLNSRQIQQGLDTFKNVPHRLELVRVLDDVEYINDSKATNVDAVYFALDSMEGEVIWIVGGVDKGNDYEPVMDLVKEKVKKVICLGKNNEKLKQIFGSSFKDLFETESTAAAVEQARLWAEAGDSVLLSPACASFDLFKNYEHRGEVFKNEVSKL